MIRIVTLTLAVAMGLVLVGCGNNTAKVPLGYEARKLTKDGMQDATLLPGIYDLGQTDNSGNGTEIVLLETSSIEEKERFMESDSDGQDHRLTTSNGTPITGDFYVIVAPPGEEAEKTKLYTLITPKDFTGGDGANNRRKVITLKMAYDHFMHGLLRGRARSLIAGYKDWPAVQAARGARVSESESEESVQGSELDEKLTALAVALQKEQGIPLKVVAAYWSNLMPDQSIKDASARENATSAEVNRLEELATAMKEDENVRLIYEWEKRAEIARILAEGKSTAVVSLGSGGDDATLGLLRQLLDKER